ncbi:MAG: hypothetical protein KJN63_03200, partial [Acidimicrobiia bacterium]|nr:hypothetical protein [Acidimicrobiia bacterium]
MKPDANGIGPVLCRHGDVSWMSPADPEGNEFRVIRETRLITCLISRRGSSPTPRSRGWGSSYANVARLGRSLADSDVPRRA